MTKRNLIIVIILLSVIDLVAAGWYVSRLIESSGKSHSLFGQHDSDASIAEADTLVSASQADVFAKTRLDSRFYVSSTPSITGDETSYFTSIKHVKVRWPKKVNGNEDLADLNKELIKRAFGSSQSDIKQARDIYLNAPSFNKPIGDEFRRLDKSPRLFPVYGNVQQILVYPYMTSQRLLVMEIDKVEYNGNLVIEDNYYVHYDRQRQHLISNLDILVADANKENQLLKLINQKIDALNKGRAEDKQLQHALNVSPEVRCGRKGIVFQYKQGALSNSPIEILINYDKLGPYMTDEFKQLQEDNEGFWIYKEEIKPEPMRPSQAYSATPLSSSAKTVKQAQTSQRKYNAAKRKSGRRARAVKRHSSRRRR